MQEEIWGSKRTCNSLRLVQQVNRAFFRSFLCRVSLVPCSATSSIIFVANSLKVSMSVKRRHYSVAFCWVGIAQFFYVEFPKDSKQGSGTFHRRWMPQMSIFLTSLAHNSAGTAKDWKAALTPYARLRSWGFMQYSSRFGAGISAKWPGFPPSFWTCFIAEHNLYESQFSHLKKWDNYTSVPHRDSVKLKLIMFAKYYVSAKNY